MAGHRRSRSVPIVVSYSFYRKTFYLVIVHQNTTSVIASSCHPATSLLVMLEKSTRTQGCSSFMLLHLRCDIEWLSHEHHLAHDCATLSLGDHRHLSYSSSEPLAALPVVIFLSSLLLLDCAILCWWDLLLFRCNFTGARMCCELRGDKLMVKRFWKRPLFLLFWACGFWFWVFVLSSFLCRWRWRSNMKKELNGWWWVEWNVN